MSPIAAPIALRIVLLVLLAAVGLALAVVGGLGWRGRLSRDSGVGVRTPGTLRCDEAFALANQVAGPPVAVAGLIMMAGGIAAFGVPTTASTIVVAAVCVAGSLVIVRTGTTMGQRAATGVTARTVATTPAAGGCGGCGDHGCSLRDQLRPVD